MTTDDARDREVTLSLADGKMPSGVHPNSRQGKHYRRLIERVRGDIAKAPKLTPEKAAAIAAMLAGGDQDVPAR